MKILVLLLPALLCGMGRAQSMRHSNLNESFKRLTCALEEAVHRARNPGGSQIDAEVAKARLLKDLALASNTQIDRHGTPVELEANENLLFDRPLVLPAEQKENGRWTFQTHRFEVVPKHIFIYSLRFKGERTLRMRSIKLFFRDGTSMLHDQWFHEEGGNGKAFSRRRFSPSLEVWRKGQPPLAKALAAIEWLGSTQDKDRNAQVELLLTVPDPASRPYLDEIRDLEQMDMAWTEPIPNPGSLQAAMNTLKKIAKALDLDWALN